MRRRNLPEARHCDAGTLAMARMPSEHDLGPIEGAAQRLMRDWDAAADAMRYLMHRHDAPQPAAPPASPHNVIRTQEVTPMQLLDEIEAHVRAAADKLGAVDHQALDALELVLANPATAEAFSILAGMAHLPPAMIATGVEVLKMVRQSAASQVPQPAVSQPQADATPPVTGGVA